MARTVSLMPSQIRIQSANSLLMTQHLSPSSPLSGFTLQRRSLTIAYIGA